MFLLHGEVDCPGQTPRKGGRRQTQYERINSILLELLWDKEAGVTLISTWDNSVILSKVQGRGDRKNVRARSWEMGSKKMFSGHDVAIAFMWSAD